MTKRALIIDDNQVFRESLADMLQELGYECLSVDSPEAAKQELEKATVDIIFCDLVLPVGISPDDDEDGSSAIVGLNTIHQLSKSTSGIPIVAMSGIMEGEALAATENFGAVDRLKKPFGLNELEQAIQRVFYR